MLDNNINKIIADALTVDKNNLNNNIIPIINQIKIAISNNKETIIEANKIDTLYYGNVTLSQKDDKKQIIYGTQIMDYGNVVVINDGNTYVIIEMILRNIMAGNTTILSNDGYMYGTNQLLIQIVQSVLEQFNISKYLVQIYISENYDEVLSNYANIDLVICIGNHSLQRLILSKSKNKTIISGYENFDLYIEDTKHIEFINKIIDTGLNIQLYINNNTKLDYPNSIIVDDIDEAIGQINYNGSKYAASIFTNSNENASKFIREVKSKIVTINTSPTIERIIDIKQRDLINEKTIIYPLNYKFDNNTININI